jgi:hypothetical protein
VGWMARVFPEEKMLATPLYSMLFQCLSDHHYIIRLIVSKHLKEVVVHKFPKESFQKELAETTIDLFKDSDVLVSIEIFQGIVDIMTQKFTP